MGSAQAAPIASPDSIRAAAAGLGLIEDAQFFFGGYDYCWYWDGWHGPGWYVCDYGPWVSGRWWGGPRGWHGWVWHGRRHDEHRKHDGKYKHLEGTAPKYKHLEGTAPKYKHHEGKAPSYSSKSGPMTSKSTGTTMKSGGGGGGGGGGRGGKH